MNPLTYEAGPGENVTDAAERMVEKANRQKRDVACVFNEITMLAKPGDKPKSVSDAYMAEMNRRHDEYKKSPEGIESAKRAEAFRKQAADAAAQGILPFNITDKTSWDLFVKNNQDGYGACVVRYAARWANLMEAKLVAGVAVKDIADKASHEADVEGITGAMYGFAVATLARVWVHGEELRRWHNKETQIGNEGDRANENGGVLNPAMLVIGK